MSPELTPEQRELARRLREVDEEHKRSGARGRLSRPERRLGLARSSWHVLALSGLIYGVFASINEAGRGVLQWGMEGSSLPISVLSAALMGGLMFLVVFLVFLPVFYLGAVVRSALVRLVRGGRP